MTMMVKPNYLSQHANCKIASAVIAAESFSHSLYGVHRNQGVNGGSLEEVVRVKAPRQHPEVIRMCCQDIIRFQHTPCTSIRRWVFVRYKNSHFTNVNKNSSLPRGDDWETECSPVITVSGAMGLICPNTTDGSVVLLTGVQRAHCVCARTDRLSAPIQFCCRIM